VAGGELRTLPAYEFKREIATQAALECQVNPEHGHRFEQAGSLKVSGIDHFEPEILAQLLDGGFCGLVVASHEHDGAVAAETWVLHVVRACGVEAFDDARVGGPLGDLFGGGGGVADAQPAEVSLERIRAVDHDFTAEISGAANCGVSDVPGRGEHNNLSKCGGFANGSGGGVLANFLEERDEVRLARVAHAEFNLVTGASPARSQGAANVA
jgi:hypothetical protein